MEEYLFTSYGHLSARRTTRQPSLAAAGNGRRRRYERAVGSIRFSEFVDFDEGAAETGPERSHLAGGYADRRHRVILYGLAQPGGDGCLQLGTRLDLRDRDARSPALLVRDCELEALYLVLASRAFDCWLDDQARLWVLAKGPEAAPRAFRSIQKSECDAGPLALQMPAGGGLMLARKVVLGDRGLFAVDDRQARLLKVGVRAGEGAPTARLCGSRAIDPADSPAWLCRSSSRLYLASSRSVLALAPGGLAVRHALRLPDGHPEAILLTACSDCELVVCLETELWVYSPCLQQRRGRLELSKMGYTARFHDLHALEVRGFTFFILLKAAYQLIIFSCCEERLDVLHSGAYRRIARRHDTVPCRPLATKSGHLLVFGGQDLRRMCHISFA